VLVSVATTGTALGRDDFFEARLTSATNLRIAIPALGSSTPTVDWQVIEYRGSSVRSGQVSFATTDTSKTATLTSVRTNKSWLVYSYQLDNNATITANISSIRGRITDATTLTFDRVTSGNAATLSYFLVAFTDRTTVQSGSQNFSTADTQNDVTITAVYTARILAAGGTCARGGQTANSTDDDVNTAWFTLALTSSTNLRLTRGMTGASAADLGWFVVQCLKRRVIIVGTTERAGRPPLRRSEPEPDRAVHGPSQPGLAPPS
jgi:hypothetical protein